MTPLPLIPEPVERDWREAAAALRDPGGTLALDGDRFAALIELLKVQRALPLFVAALQASGAWDRLEPSRRDPLQQWWVSYQGIAGMALDEVVEVVASFVAAGLHPVVLKGCALAWQAYEAPHLRPFADLDVLFADRAEALAAFALLESQGYRRQEESRGGDPFLWSRHLPEMRHGDRLLTVEVHGGLVWPPRDRRSAREKPLLDGLEAQAYGSAGARVLRAEAAIVYAFAHALVRHEAEPPSLAPLLDTRAVVEARGAAFDWDRLAVLARETGFAAPVAAGLTACREVLDLPLPEPVAAWCGEVLAGPRRRRSAAPQAVRSASHLAGILHADSPAAVASMLFRSTLPTRAFMRWRYPDKQRWPLAALYPYRWALQALKLATYGAGVARRIAGRRDRPDEAALARANA